MNPIVLGGPGLACSAMRVRRLVAGELGGAERARAEEHLAACARCRAVREEIAAEERALAEALPFPAFAAGVAERMARRDRGRSSRRALPLALAAGLLAAAAVPLVLRVAREDEGIRPKGGTPAASLELHALAAGGARLLGPAEPVPAGARLRVSVQPAGRRFAALVLLDADGAAPLYAGPAAAGPLPGAFEWTGSAAEGTLVLLLADEPVDVGALRARLARGVAAASPGGTAEVLLRPLRREARR